MKILVINHEFPPVGGGAATASKHIIEHLMQTNEKIEVITSAFNGLPFEEEINNYTINRVYAGRRRADAGSVLEYTLFVINGGIFLNKHIEKIKPDLVYAFFTLPAGLIALFLKKVHRIPYFVFLRGIDVPGFYGGGYSWLNKALTPLIKYIWINADKVIANSQGLKELACADFKKKPVYVIPNGINTAEFYPARQKKTNRLIKILYVGRLSKQKGLRYLLDAIAIINKTAGPDFVLEIVGEGPERKRLIKKSSKLNILDKVIFSGWSNRDGILSKYQDADVFVSVALAEGMPNTILEAMAVGLPVVVSDIPPHKELIIANKNGIFVPPKTSGPLADAIIFLIENTALRRTMGDANAQKAKGHSWQSSASKLELLNKQSSL